MRFNFGIIGLVKGFHDLVSDDIAEKLLEGHFKPSDFPVLQSTKGSSHSVSVSTSSSYQKVGDDIRETHTERYANTDNNDGKISRKVAASESKSHNGESKTRGGVFVGEGDEGVLLNQHDKETQADLFGGVTHEEINKARALFKDISGRGFLRGFLE